MNKPLFLQSFNPSTNALLGQVKVDEELSLKNKIKQLNQGQISWAERGFDHRIKAMRQFALRVKEKKDELAQLISDESAKALWDAQGEVQAVINKVEIAIQSCTQRTPPFNPASFGTVKEVADSVFYKPLGVVLVLGPYNFPAHLPNGHIIPALLAGNSVLFKPSEQTPLVGQWLVENLWDVGCDFGLDETTITTAMGDGSVGQLLVGLASGQTDTPAQKPQDKSQGIAAVCFTGSSQTARAIHKSFAGRFDVLLALEAGGNNPLVVWDLDSPQEVQKAVELVVRSSFISSGQRCTCSRRLIVPNGTLGDDLIAELLHQIDELKVGYPYDRPEPFITPLISEQSATNFKTQRSELIKQGCKCFI